MSINELVDYDENKLAIMPEGWTQTIFFEDGNWSCGSAYNGISIGIGERRGGGVLSNDDAAELLDFLKNHFRRLAGDLKDEEEE